MTLVGTMQPLAGFLNMNTNQSLVLKIGFSQGVKTANYKCWEIN